MKRTQAMRRWSGGDWRIGRVRKDREARGIGQSVWLKRLVRMLRAQRSLSQAGTRGHARRRSKQGVRSLIN